MANSIKYSTSAQSLALKTGDFWIGTGDVGKGPTSTTDFWSAINPSNIDNDFADGYTIYVNKASQGPSIRVASSDAELITITNQISGNSYATINDCFDYFLTQGDKFVLNSYINPIITDGLVLAWGSNLVPSYPRNGTTWYDLSGEGNNGTLTNGPTFNSNGYFDFDGNNDYITVSNLGLSSHTIEGWFNSADGSQGGTGAATLISIFGTYAASAFKYTYIGLRPELTFRIDDGIDSHIQILNYTYTADTWYHVALTYNASDGATKAYVNGSFENGITSTENITFNDVPFNVAKTNYTTPTYFEGSTSSVRVYNKALTASEISQNYYQSKIVTDDLILALDPGNLVSYENGSTTTYSLVGTNTGTLTGGVAFDGGNGGIWEFDGNDDRIESFSNSVQPATITIEFWKKWTSVSDDWLIGNQTSSPTQNNYGWYARIDSPSYNFFVRFGIGSTSRSITYNPIVLNEWTHVVATYDPTSEGAKLYWNGELVGTNTNAGALDYTNVLGLEIGGANDGSRDTPGPVGPVRIYDRVLTAGEVAQNYGAEKGRFSNVSIAPQA